MLIVICATVLLTIFALPLLAWKHFGLKEQDVLHPLYIISGLHILRIIPFLYMAAVTPELTFFYIRPQYSVRALEGAVCWYTVVQGLGFCALILGFMVRWPQHLARRLPRLQPDFSPRRAKRAMLVALAVGLTGWSLFLHQVGGLQVLLANLANRVDLYSNSGYVLSLIPLLTLGVVIYVSSLPAKPSWRDKIILGGLMLGVAVVLSSLGQRTPTIHMLLAVTIAWHYRVSRMGARLMLWRVALMVMLLTPYIIGVYLIRSETNAFSSYAQDPGSLVSGAADSSSTTLMQINSVYRQLLIVSYFHPDNLWLGRSYLDLLTAPIPRRFLPKKSPVDDGVYLYALLMGDEVRPPMAYDQMAQSSVPPSSIGIMYINFWLPGVIVGLFLLGGIYQLAYRYLQYSGYHPFALVIYGRILLSFSLSNLGIMNGAMSILLATSFFLLFFRLDRGRRPSAVPAPLAGGAG